MKPRRRRPTTLAALATETALASWETIFRRTGMIATGACSAAEYRQMVWEKAEAMMASGAALWRPSPSVADLLAPWHKRATANARRLRRK